MGVKTGVNLLTKVAVITVLPKIYPKRLGLANVVLTLEIFTQENCGLLCDSVAPHHGKSCVIPFLWQSMMTGVNRLSQQVAMLR
jgi:hypothetical protein